MIKKFYRFLLESQGINKSLEDQVDDMFNVVNLPGNKDKKVFNMVYHCNGINTFFILQYGLDKKIHNNGPMLSEEGAAGYFNISKDADTGRILDIRITIDQKSNKSTLLHEVKHLDYSIRNNKWENNIFYKERNKIQSFNSKSYKSIRTIFYLYDKNEFEAKYHGYYVSLDESMRNVIKYIPNEKRTKKMISDLSKGYIKSFDDQSFIWWTNGEIKFSNYMNEREINNLFYYLIKNYDNSVTFADITLLPFREAANIVTHIIKSKLNIYTKKDKELINKLKDRYEKEINRRRKVFEKKFYRLVTLMVDKYAIA